MFAVQPGPAQQLGRFAEGRHDHLARMVAHRMAHAVFQQAVHGLQVLGGGADIVQAAAVQREAGGRAQARREEQREEGGLDDQAGAVGGHGWVNRIVLKKLHHFRYYKSHPPRRTDA
jgi:hypothetical protein